MEYRCVQGHDKCAEMYPGPDCPYCERTERAYWAEHTLPNPELEPEPDGMLAYALALEIQDRNDPSWPLPSFDAREWAKSFVELVRRKPEIATDEATMTTWFAGALMRGHDERVRRERQPK